MELVRGTSITTWCDQNKVDLRGRLELLIPVCLAIQHAHQKGIIHRDIKPSNVMVAMFDGQPVPKVIDFGIAKAFGTSLTEMSLHTAFGAVVGTAEYMSPEQAELNNLDIDTRSDVYSLGVLMYELLTGSTPFPRAELAERGWQEALRVIRDVDPPVPSLRLSTSKMRASIAAVRSIEPNELDKLLKSELDWVVMKSLEKDRSRRYESASAIVNDLQRYLRDEPVEACPPSAIYKSRKFIRRHRWAVLASTLVLVSLIAGVIGTSWGLMHAKAQRRIAEQARHEADERAISERTAKLEAQRQQRIAEAAEDATLDSYKESTNDVIEKLIGSKDSIGTAERSYLESAHRRWQAFADRQGSDERSRYIRALGNRHLGLIWGDLNHPSDAVAALENAIRILDELASQHPAKLHYRVEAAIARRLLATSLRELGKNAQAEAESRKGVQLLEQVVAQHPEHEGYRFDLGLSCDALGATLNALGRKEAEDEYRRSLRIFQQLASDYPDASRYRRQVSRLQSNLGNLLEYAGYTEEPEKLFRDAVAISETLVSEFPADADYRYQLADRYWSLGRFLRFRLAKPNEGIGQLQLAIEILNKLANDFPSVPVYRSDLADASTDLSQILTMQGRFDQAHLQLMKSKSIYEQLVNYFPDVHGYKRGLCNAHCLLGELYKAQGQWEESLEWFDKAVATIKPVVDRQGAGSSGHAGLTSSLSGRASVLSKLGKDTPADWEAIRESMPQEGPVYRKIQRSIILLRSGKVSEAVDEITLLMNAAEDKSVSQPWTFVEWFDAACFFSIASEKSSDKKEEYAARSLELLTRAVKAGFIDVEHLQRDSDLEPIRERAEFKQLLETIKK